MRLNTELSKLKTMDIYSVMLFALFKMTNMPEYSTLSELAYILDKESFLKLCEYFGGLTIKIPTVDELESVVNALILYQYIDIEGMTFDAAAKLLNRGGEDLRLVKLNYAKLKEVLVDYTFAQRQKVED